MKASKGRRSFEGIVLVADVSSAIDGSFTLVEVIMLTRIQRSCTKPRKDLEMPKQLRDLNEKLTEKWDKRSLYILRSLPPDEL